MEVKYFVSHNDQRIGPLTREEISAKLDKTELFPTDYVYVEDLKDWVMLADFFGHSTTENFSSVNENPPALSHPPTLQQNSATIDQQLIQESSPEISALNSHPPSLEKEDSKGNEEPPSLIRDTRPLFDINSEEKSQSLADKSSDGFVSFKLESANTPTLTKDTVRASSQEQAPTVNKTEESNVVEEPTPLNPPTLPTTNARTQTSTQNHTTQEPTNVMLHTGGEKKNLHFSDGVASLRLKSEVAEPIQFKLKAERFSSEAVSEIKLTPGPVKRLQFQGATRISAKAGEKFSIQVTACDAFGNHCSNFNGKGKLVCEPGKSDWPTLSFSSGTAQAELSHTTAGLLKVDAQLEDDPQIKSESPLQVQIIAAPAVRLIIEPQSDQVAVGDSIELRLKAVDQFGNVDTQFSGPLDLQISGIGALSGQLTIQDGVFKKKAG